MQDFQQASDQESLEGLLEESESSGGRLKFNGQLDRMSGCCKHAWTKSKRYQLAYCMKCKPIMLAKVENTKQKGDNMLGKTVLCRDKGKRRSHTLANLEDLIEMTAKNRYMGSVVQTKNENC